MRQSPYRDGRPPFVSFPGDIQTMLFQEALDEIAEKLPNLSQHERVTAYATFQTHMGCWGGRITCTECGSEKRVYVTMGAVALAMSKPVRAWDNSEGGAVEWWTRLCIPAMAPLIDSPCWNPKGLAATAEWLTDAVSRGGAHGRDLKALIQWARHEGGVPAERVLWLLERMGFTPKSALVPARIRLPLGHPLRTWEEDLPHPGDGTLDESVLLALDWPL